MNFPPTLFSGRRYLVLGLGRNGLPAAQALQAMGATVTVWDDRASARDEAAACGLRVCSPSGGFAADALVLSPGIPHRLPKPHPVACWAASHHIPILSDADLLYQAVRASGSRARFAGITGTNGKSTTTALLAHIIEGAGIPVRAGGNLGTAALALGALPDTGVYVLEMSSYMLERLAHLRFDAAALLNLSPDHLDRHGDMAGYLTAKRAIFDRQTADDSAILGVDDPMTAGVVGTLPARNVTISGFATAMFTCFAGILTGPRGAIVAMRDAPALPGVHNAQNAAAAAAMATALGIGTAAIARGIKSFAGLPHRQQRVGRIAGVDYINDSKATNSDAAARALACYPKLIWIAGGIAKADGITPLGRYFPRIAEALLIGRDAPLLAQTLAAHGVPHRLVGTLDAAVPAAAEAARRLGAPVVLLSPACASFDQFTGFDARGDRFAALVSGLHAGHANGEAA
jgi:UDP-N-acetylmuramoylalanine--D-glutamate ligase